MVDDVADGAAVHGNTNLDLLSGRGLQHALGVVHDGQSF